MSNQSQGHGWWLADDDLWYPPERHPDPTYMASLTEPPPPAQEFTPPGAPTEPETTPQNHVANQWGDLSAPPVQNAGNLPQPGAHSTYGTPQQGPWGQPRQWGQGYGPGQPGPRAHVPQRWVVPEAVPRPARPGSWPKAVFGGLCLFICVAVMAYGNGPMFAELIDLNGRRNVIMWRLMLVWLVVLAVVVLVFWVFMHMASDRKRLTSQMGVFFGALLVGLIPIFGFAGIDKNSPFLPHDRLGWAIVTCLGFFVFALWRLSTRRQLTRSTRLPEAVSYVVPILALLWGMLIFAAGDFAPDWFNTRSSSDSSGSGTDLTVHPNAMNDDDLDLESRTYPAFETTTTTTVPEPVVPTAENVYEFHGITPLHRGMTAEEETSYYRHVNFAFSGVKDDFCHAYAFMAALYLQNPGDLPYNPTYETFEALFDMMIHQLEWGLSESSSEQDKKLLNDWLSVYRDLRDPEIIAVMTDDPRVPLTDREWNAAISRFRQIEPRINSLTSRSNWAVGVDHRYALRC